MLAPALPDRTGHCVTGVRQADDVRPRHAQARHDLHHLHPARRVLVKADVDFPETLQPVPAQVNPAGVFRAARHTHGRVAVLRPGNGIEFALTNYQLAAVRNGGFHTR